MKLQSTKIIDILESLNDLNALKYQLSDDFVITSSDIEIEFTFYGERRFPYYENVAGENQFVKAWQRYCHENSLNWLRAWNAMRAQYEPLDNYSMKETENIHHAGDDIIDREIHTHRESGTVSPTEVRNYVTSYENLSGALANYSTQSVDNNEAENGTDTVTQTTADIDRTLTRSGNIGVTTSQQMLKAELELRLKTDLKQRMIDGFIMEYTYMGGC